MAAVMIWSSCFAPVPPIFILPGPACFAASMNSLAFLYGVLAFTHSTKLSSASICTGVRSRQLNGTPVASGVVKRFDSVMMILCGSPEAFFTSRKPSAPAPPALLMGRIDCFIRLCLATMPWMARAIWSAPPPVPAGMMNSTFLVGSQDCACAANGAVSAKLRTTVLRNACFMTPPKVSPFAAPHHSLWCWRQGFSCSPPRVGHDFGQDFGPAFADQRSGGHYDDRAG